MSRWETLLAIDFDKWAAETYRANFPGVRVECAPVSKFLEHPNGLHALPDADVVLGGPPCQPHSYAGNRLASKDDRDCGPDFAEYVRLKQPRMFLMENVDGLLTSEGGRYFQRLYAALEGGGYVLQYRVLDAVDFGVPQFRSRLWVWGIRADLYRDGVRHCWPVPTHAWPPPEPCMFGASLLPGVTVGQALGIDGYELRRHRGAGWGDRRAHPLHEPSPTINGGNGDGGSTGAIYLQVVGGGANPRKPGGARIERDITHEPSTTIPAECGNNAVPLIVGIFDAQNETAHHLDRPCGTIQGNAQAKGGKAGHYAVMEYRWSDAMYAKHPPASPAPTVQAKYYKGGAEGMLAVDAPAHTSSGESREPIQGWKNKGYVRRLLPLECARLQSVHDGFAWPEGIGKTAMYKVVGNGWASLMAWRMSQALAAADSDSRSVADLFCGGGLGASGWHGRFWRYEAGDEVEVRTARPRGRAGK